MDNRSRFIHSEGSLYLLSVKEKNTFKEGFSFKKVSHVSNNLFKILGQYGHMFQYVYKLINLNPLPSNWESKRFFMKGRALISILDLTTDLEKFKNHERLKTFYNKGLDCSNPKCNKRGHYLLLTLGNMKNDNVGFGIHVDVFTESLELMTVDHILPKSKGGTYDLENLRPMCYKCNSRLGNSQAY